MSIFDIVLILISTTIVIFITLQMRNTLKFYFKYLLFYLYLFYAPLTSLLLSLKNPLNCKTLLITASLIEPYASQVGIKWRIKNGEKILDANKKAIFISNHQSLLDIGAMLHLWHKNRINCSVIVKSSFIWFGPIGWALWIGGAIFVKRNSKTAKTITAFNNATKKLFKNPNKLWMYVEGTRNQTPDTLLPFKLGAFIAAIENQVPLQPVLISPFNFIDFKNKQFNSGTVIIEVLDPIPTEGLTKDDVNALKEKAYDIMSRKNTELRNEMQLFLRNTEEQKFKQS